MLLLCGSADVLGVGSAKPSGERIIRYATCEDLLCGPAPGLRATGVRRRQRAPADHRSLCAGQVHGPGAGRAGGADLRARARAGGHGAAWRGGRRSDRALRPRRRHAEVAFDVPQPDYSWMAFLARAGFDTFAMDTTGYGRSIRPAAMNDPCNLARIGRRRSSSAACAPSYPHSMTTIASDWNDIGAVVDYIRALRRGQGQPAGVVARRPARRRLRGAESREGEQARAARARLQPRRARGRAGEESARRHGDEHSVARRLRPTGIARSAARRSTSRRCRRVWSEMLASDPGRRDLGPGVRRRRRRRPGAGTRRWSGRCWRPP